MKSGEGKALFDNCIKRGWYHDKKTNRVYTPAEALSFNLGPKKKRKAKTARTYDTNDHLNIANKAKHCDRFTRLLEIELKIDCWPEYRFAKEKGYKLDYALPDHRVGLEVQGGIWARGKSGHSSGKGITRDMNKLNLLTTNGWKLIQVTPSQLLTAETIELIKKAIGNVAKNRYI